MKQFIMVLIGLFVLIKVHAASFDCNKAGSKVEKMICTDDQLSKSDEELAQVFSAALKETQDVTVLMKQQREWLASVRNQCDAVHCLMGVYASRIRKLKYPEEGIWLGTIGDKNILACIQYPDDTQKTNLSGYFYAGKTQIIQLNLYKEQINAWYEGALEKSTGIWLLENRYGNYLKGKWSDSGKVNILPIKLSRLRDLFSSDFEFNYFGCDSSAGIFNPLTYSRIQKDLELLSKSKYDKSLNQSLDIFGKVISTQLAGEGEVLKDINDRLKNELLIGMAEYYECGAVRRNGVIDYESKVSVMFRNDRWVTFEKTISGDCGGAHPFFDSSYSTWNMQSGMKVNLWSWILESQKINNDAEGELKLSKLFMTIIEQALFQRYGKNPKEGSLDDCYSVISENVSYQLLLGTTGFKFSTNFPHAVQACSDTVEIPYQKMIPFLSKEGRDAVQVLVNH